MGLNKKIIILGTVVAGIATALVLLYNSFSKLKDLDLNDPFEVDFDDE